MFRYLLRWHVTERVLDGESEGQSSGPNSLISYTSLEKKKKNQLNIQRIIFLKCKTRVGKRYNKIFYLVRQITISGEKRKILERLLH